MPMSRRSLLQSAILAVFGSALASRPVLAAKGDFPFRLSEEEWRARLDPAAYAVLREEGTERAYTSPLNDEKRPGLYHCAGCDQALFESGKKYDSGTGWPSFWDHLPGAIGTSVDNSLWMTRIEVHCANCGGHQGHVFEGGPEPTGLRYCINGVALRFVPAA